MQALLKEAQARLSLHWGINSKSLTPPPSDTESWESERQRGTSHRPYPQKPQRVGDLRGRWENGL